MPKPPEPRAKIASGVSFVEEPDYGVRPDKPASATPAAPLDEVERALALLDGRHPDAMRVERKTQAALATKKAAADARARADRDADRRRWLIRGAVGLAVTVPLVAAGLQYSRRAAREKAALAALAPDIAPYVSRGFAPVGAVRFAQEPVELELTEAGCFIAVASRAPGDGALVVERPAGPLTGDGSVAWCTCGAEIATARLKNPAGAGAIVVLRAGAADVGGHHGLFFVEPLPHVIAPPDDCSLDALDTWIDKGTALRRKDDALDEEMRATLGRAGFTVAGSAGSSLPFAVVAGATDSCAIAWSSAPRDALSLRLKGGARPLADVIGPIGFCGSRAESVTVWRRGMGELVIERVPASRVGGTHGLEEAAPRLGLALGSAVSAWVSEEDLAWDATATLRASGVVPAEITVSTDGRAVKDARVVALSIAGATVLADASRDAITSCEPALTPTTRSAVCVQSAALPWRTVGAVGKAGIAEATMPFWMEASTGATDPRALAAQLSLLKLGRRLVAEGFEATSRDGVTDFEGGATIAGRGGSDGIVAVQIARDPPWVSPCSSSGTSEVWTVDGDPAVLSLAPGAQLRLACSPRAASDHRTVVFRHVAAKPPGH